MQHHEYIQLKLELQTHVTQFLNVNWGAVQNNQFDSQLNIFSIATYQQLENELQQFDDLVKNYYRKRWFIYNCSRCDEYLFYCNKNVTANALAKDKNYDIEFNNDKNLRFDIKGTVIPKQFKHNAAEAINNVAQLVHFFYEQQSQQMRYGLQNRLFIVHHSFKQPQREMILRCHFDFKQQAFEQYAWHITTAPNLLQYHNAIADIIFILENKDGSFEFTFASKKQ